VGIVRARQEQQQGEYGSSCDKRNDLNYGNVERRAFASIKYIAETISRRAVASIKYIAETISRRANASIKFIAETQAQRKQFTEITFGQENIRRRIFCKNRSSNNKLQIFTDAATMTGNGHHWFSVEIRLHDSHTFINVSRNIIVLQTKIQVWANAQMFTTQTDVFFRPVYGKNDLTFFENIIKRIFSEKVATVSSFGRRIKLKLIKVISKIFGYDPVPVYLNVLLENAKINEINSFINYFVAITRERDIDVRFRLTLQNDSVVNRVLRCDPEIIKRIFSEKVATASSIVRRIKLKLINVISRIFGCDPAPVYLNILLKNAKIEKYEINNKFNGLMSVLFIIVDLEGKKGYKKDYG
jgi:hypothetical protein